MTQAQPMTPQQQSPTPPKAPPVSPPVQGGPENPPNPAAPKNAEPSGDTNSSKPASRGTEEPPDTKVGSGKGAEEATSRSGQSTSLHEHLRQAQHHLVDGDLVGGDKNVFLIGGTEPVQLRMLARHRREAVRHAFVFPSGWDDLRLRFNQRRVVILSGAVGRGRTGTAIRLLQTTAIETVYDLDPKVDLGRLGTVITGSGNGSERKSAGYLLCQPADTSQLNAWLFQSLEETLERSDARLVLTVGPDALPDNDDLMRYVVRLNSPPSIQDILTRHLGWRRNEEEAEQLLAHPRLKEFVREYLAPDLSFELTAQLAEWIAQEPVDAVDMDRLRGRLARRRDVFEVWFDSLPDLGARSFAIALAVLEGLSIEDVSAAAHRLYQRLDTAKQVEFELAPSKRSQGTDPFAVTLRQRLSQLQAVQEMSANRGYDLRPATVLSYRDRDYAKKIIVRAWQDFQLQDVLLDWLVELSENSSEQIRIYAGTALGVIATLSFDYVVAEELNDAADSDSRHRRESVAVALRVAAEDKRLLPAVQGLVDGWYGDHANPNRQATAARAYGLGPKLGGAGTDLIANVTALDRLATVDEIAVAAAIGESFASLILTDNQLVTPKVYETLLTWFDDRRRAAQGHLAFLLCAVSLSKDVSRPGEEGASTRWPTLLWLAREHAELREPFFLLWHRVLDEAVLRQAADVVLTAWAGLAETDGDLRDAFVRMVRVVASHKGRTHQSLARLAKDWISEERLQPMPIVSAAVTAVI